MRLPRILALAAIAPLVAAACGSEPLVTAQRADRIAPGAAGPVFGSADSDVAISPTDSAPAEAGSPATEPATTGPPATNPPDTGPTESSPPETIPPETVAPVPIDPAAIDFGTDKPSRSYDEFLLATVADIEAWWTDEFPAVYGSTFQPLKGRIIAAYPGRADDIPGCGAPRTTYAEVREYAAFYCGVGDFMVYDDGDGGLLSVLAERFGAAAIAIVLAHEYGHAIQLRIDALDTGLSTITTEQQADCFAGAWSARAASGRSANIRFTDDDLRAGLISMLEVRDPVGLDQLSEGGHGSGFDRVGAFQVGFFGGAARCESLLRDPLPLSPAQFLSTDDLASGGNAPWGYGDQQLFEMLPGDLNLYWGSDLSETAGTFRPLAVVAVQSAAETECERLDPRFAHGAGLCLDDGSSDTVYINEPAAFDLYRQELFGDFSVGYLLGIAWAEAAQRMLDSARAGEARELYSDCLAGAWVQTDIASRVGDQFLLPQPRHPERGLRISPGDLDETVRTMILIGDTRADENILGTPFEKIEAFRSGLLGGISACGG
ncbi:MAG: neutral zinc metallopeptidase [Acidimicrobiia bacterium]|nr:neutral zinc metallopeptidase [Acidimicrobiia bacterium]